MRITNKMMVNNSLLNINRNKNRMNDLDIQYSSGKKVQRPSDDPIIAVRALKLRTTVVETKQYVERNVADAMSWMDTTEHSIKNINEIITKMSTEYNQASNDILTKSDRDSIINNLLEMNAQILQEGNTNYADRYVFTGYKTNTPLIFNKETDLEYNITEKVSGNKIEQVKNVVGAYELSDYNPATSTADDFANSPKQVEYYRLQLSYSKLNSIDQNNIIITQPDGTKSDITNYGNVVEKKSIDKDAYIVGDDDIHLIADTGEIIFGKAVFEKIRQVGEDGISVNYIKNQFNKGDLRPENYFDCVVTDKSIVPNKVSNYVKEDENIEYEITFKQKLKINTEGKDVIKHKMGREIEEAKNLSNKLDQIEIKISEVEKLLSARDITQEQKKTLEKLNEQLKLEQSLTDKLFADKLRHGLTVTKDYQKVVSIAIADAGSRYVRLELTEDRLSQQLVDTKELMSKNEDVNMAEVIIAYQSASAIYNASLNAAAKMIKTSLLDYI